MRHVKTPCLPLVVNCGGGSGEGSVVTDLTYDEATKLLTLEQSSGGTHAADLSALDQPQPDPTALTPQMFGAAGDGVADDTEAFRAMAEGARALQLNMYVPGGTYLLTGTINLYHPAELVTHANALLVFSGMGGWGGSDGFVILQDPNLLGDQGKYRTSRVSGFSVRLIGGNGGDFIRTPQGTPTQGTNILNGVAPMFLFENMQINGDQTPITSHISQHNWTNVFHIGGSNAATVRNCIANGGYNPNAAPTEESTRSVFVRLSSSQDNDDAPLGALRSPFITNNVVMHFGRAVDFGRSVSRAQVSHFYVHNCWEGFIGDLTAASGVGEAGEVSIANCNINVQHRALAFAGRNNGVMLVDVDCTRAPGAFDHDQGWTGLTTVGTYRVSMTNVGFRCEHAYDNSEIVGARITSAQSVIADGVFLKNAAGQSIDVGLDIINPAKVNLNGVHNMLRAGTLVRLSGSVTAATNVTLSSVGVTQAGQIPNVTRLELQGDVTAAHVNDLDFVGTAGLLIAAAGSTDRRFAFPTYTELTGRSSEGLPANSLVPIYNATTGAPVAARAATANPIAATIPLRTAGGQLQATRAETGAQLVRLDQTTRVQGMTIAAPGSVTVVPDAIKTTVFVTLDDTDLSSDDAVHILIDPYADNVRVGNEIEVRVAGFSSATQAQVRVGTGDTDDTAPDAINARVLVAPSTGSFLYSLRGIIIAGGADTKRYRVLTEHYLNVSVGPGPQPGYAPVNVQPPEIIAGGGVLASPFEAPVEGHGINLASVDDWSGGYQFVNLMKNCRGWIAGGMGTEELREQGHLNERYAPVSLPSGATEFTSYMFADGPTPNTQAPMLGDYVMAWDGDPAVTVGGGVANVQAVTGGLAFTYTGGTMWVNVVPGAEPPSYMTLTRQEDEGTSDTFRPEWTSLIDNATQLRFMGWQHTNGSTQSAWEDRPHPDDLMYSTRAGVPVEAMVALANELGVIPWFCIPHLATEDYTRRFTTYVRDNLTAPYAVFEYSNETWNWAADFTQTHWLQDQAQARWPGVGDGWMQLSGGKFVEMAKVIREVYAAQPDRCVLVLSPQTGWEGLEQPLYHAPLWLADNPGESAPYTHADAVALTGYFDYGFSDPANAATINDWLDEGGVAYAMAQAQIQFDTAALLPQAGSTVESVVSNWNYHKQQAEVLGLPLTMYEGGTHIECPTAVQAHPLGVEFYHTLNYSPALVSVYERLTAEWANYGKRFNFFVDVVAPNNIRAFGHARWLGDTNPRLQYMLDFQPNQGATT